MSDAISELAAGDATTRAAMTAGFIALGTGVPLFGLSLRKELSGPAWTTAVATGLTTLGVAAFPLGASSSDLVHGLFAAAGYASLAATPLLASGPLERGGRKSWARVSKIAGIASGLCLIVSARGDYHGLFQRLGLTIGHAWIIATATAVVLGRRLEDDDGDRA